jgi:FKBP-type peptidyl-prolyl cis-trans isomerase 2
MASTAGDGKVVSIHYTLKDDDGDVVDSSSGG